MRLRILSLISLSFISVLPGLAQACPEHLKNFRSEYLQDLDVCRIHDRYEAALNKLRDKNFFPPERIGNLMAPRFINSPDWLEKRDRNSDRALLAYEPAPITWASWEAGVKLVDEAALKNFSQRRMTPISLDWLKHVHGATLNGLANSAGKFREGGEIGMAIRDRTSLTAAEALAVQHIEYKSSSGESLISFRPTQCLEERDEAFQNRFQYQMANRMGFFTDEWPAIDPRKFYTNPKGQAKQCGFYTYAPISEVPRELDKWLQYLNESILTWGSENPQNDPILVAARAQRWFIVIHPYETGNGRSSRFVMELLLRSIGLPAPILEDMNADLYSSETEWAKKVGQGVLRAVRAAEFCSFRPGSKGCTIITHKSTGVVP